MRTAAIGLVLAGVMLLSTTGCLSGTSASDLLGAAASGQSQDQSGNALADTLSSDALGALQGNVSKRDLLASLIDLMATSSGASGTDALVWDVASAAVRDGKQGVEQSVAKFVVQQLTQSITANATTQPSQTTNP